MLNFWDSNIWSWLLLLAVLMGSLLVGNTLRRKIPLLRKSLIPTSVIGGGVLLIVASIYKAISGEVMFDTSAFGYTGTANLEVITYHALALGFIASSLKVSDRKLTGKRATEIFNTGVTTVSTYLLQGVVGLGITIIAALFISGFFAGAGILLPFGYGQGTGQAMNYGLMFETENGFVGGTDFGLTIAALGFISAALGGVFHLNIKKARGRLKVSERKDGGDQNEAVDSPDEIPMQESVDKLTIQLSLIVVAYVIAYLFMFILGELFQGMRATIYGFNFLLGVIGAMIVKSVLKLLRKSGLMKRQYTNNFLMTRTSNLFFDIMVVSGIAAIRLDSIESSWLVIIILGVIGAAITYGYLYFVCKKLFPEYAEEEFLMMYGMLTGTACTGTILLREIDGDFHTPAADNMVYQNLPAIAFGFPLMIIAKLAPTQPLLTLIILAAFFLLMNVILFRSFIFKKRKSKAKKEPALK